MTINKKNNHLKIIDAIENIRKKNNVNWMNLLKIGFKYAPKETKKTLTKIYSDDTKISSLVKKLNS